MTSTQRRHYSRIAFHGDATIEIGSQQTGCTVQDLSLKGALVVPVASLAAEPGASCRLVVKLDGDNTVVCMDGEVAHCEDARIGLTCRNIDLDSITHLRRLLELNLGDTALLDREFSTLLAP